MCNPNTILKLISVRVMEFSLALISVVYNFNTMDQYILDVHQVLTGFGLSFTEMLYFLAFPTAWLTDICFLSTCSEDTHIPL